MKRCNRCKWMGFLLATAVMLSLLVIPNNVFGEGNDYVVDLGGLNGESAHVTVRDGYPDALYPEGAYVLQFAGGCGYIYLGNMDLSKYDKVVLNVGSSASAVFNNSNGRAFLALTSNGPVANGNKNDGITKIDSANIISQQNLSSPPGRWGSAEQIVTIALDTDYSGDVYLAYGPIIRDNNGTPTLDSIVVSKIVFKEESTIIKPPAPKWQDVENMESYSYVDFDEANADKDTAETLSSFNEFWAIERGQYFYFYENNDGDIYGKIDDTNFFAAQHLDITENNPYIFSFDAQIGTAFYCFFVRGTEPTVRANPAWKEAAIRWYEKDWYKENNGSAQGAASTTGASGIALTKGNSDNTIALVVKTYEEDGINIASRVFNIPVNADVVNEMNSYKIYDDGNGIIKYYLNDELFAVVEYSEPTTYEDEYDDTDEFLFYKKVVVKDAYGEVLGNVDNSRLSQEGVIAMGFRKTSGTINYVDNLSVSFGKKAEATFTPSPEIVSTPEATIEATIPVTSTPVATNAPVVNDIDTQSSNYIPLIIGAVVVGVIAIMIIAIIIRKKKK